MHAKKKIVQNNIDYTFTNNKDGTNNNDFVHIPKTVSIETRHKCTVTTCTGQIRNDRYMIWHKDMLLSWH